MSNVTIVVDFITVWGNKRVSIGKITMSTAYATGGDSYVASDFQLTKLTKLMLNGPASGRALVPDETNKKVLAYSAGTEVTAATNLSADVVNFIAIE